MVRFECQPGCTACCRRRGFVYLTEQDVSNAARFLGVSIAGFESRYIYRTRNLRRLRVGRGVGCPFLRSDGCAIHPAKPAQCRIFPFWPELVEDEHAWRTAGNSCAGIGRGRAVSKKTARRLAEEMRLAHPALYDLPHGVDAVRR